MHEIIIKLNLGELAFYVLPEPANRQNRLNGLTCLKNTRCLTPFQGLDKAGSSGSGSLLNLNRIIAILPMGVHHSNIIFRFDR